MTIRRGTTPTIMVSFKNDVEIDKVTQVVVTLKQDDVEITRTKDEIEIDTQNETIRLTLTQEETLSLRCGACVFMQVRGTAGGQAFASAINRIAVSDVLNNEVI